jgi:hypothetical protein
MGVEDPARPGKWLRVMAASQIVLIVFPSLDAQGKKAYGNRGLLFNGRVGDRVIIKRSATPFCDAARALLDEGAMPDTPRQGDQPFAG